MLGEPVLICYDGDKSGEGELIIVIAEEGTETTILDYNGEEIEMQKTETPCRHREPCSGVRDAGPCARRPRGILLELERS